MRLDQPPPRERPEGKATPTFHPGVYNFSYGGSDIGLKLQPAYQYMRLIEESALPPRAGNIIVGIDELRSAANWLAEYDPVRTLSVINRIGDDKLIDHFLSRHRVAILQLNVVSDLRTSTMKAIRHALPHAPIDTRPETDLENRALDRLKTGLRLLTRICIRDTATDLSEVWELAHELYQHPVVRAGLVTGKELGELLRSLIETTDRSNLADRLPRLFELPLPGEGGFIVTMADWWRDPSRMVNTERLGEITDRAAPRWAYIKRHLFGLLDVENSSLKQAAFERLVSLNEFGLMSASERRQLGLHFWVSTSQGPDLPLSMWGPQAAFRALTLPGPRGMPAEERVRHYILTDKLIGPVPGVVWPERYLELIRFASAPLTHREHLLVDRRFIAWTQTDLRVLCEGIRDWWQNTGQERAVKRNERRGWGWLIGDNAFGRFVNCLWDVLRVAIVPEIVLVYRSLR